MKRTRWLGTLLVLMFALFSGGVPSLQTSAAAPAERGASLAEPASVAVLTACEDGFSDLTASSPFFGYVRCLVCAGVISGSMDGTFRSGGTLTRGEMSRWVALAAGYTAVIPRSQQTFVDVPPTDPNWLYIELLDRHGVINGYPCGQAPGGPCPGRYFRPENLITRAQTAKLVTRAAGYTDAIGPTTQTFREVPPTHPYWLYVERAVVHGLISGYDCDNVTYNVCGPTFEKCPGPYYRCCANVTRSQAAKFIALAFFPGCSTP